MIIATRKTHRLWLLIWYFQTFVSYELQKKLFWMIKSYHETILYILQYYVRRVWRYQRDNQNPWIEEEQTIQWPIEKVQTDKQRSTKHTHIAKDRVTRTPLTIGGELRVANQICVISFLHTVKTSFKTLPMCCLSVWCIVPPVAIARRWKKEKDRSIRSIIIKTNIAEHKRHTHSSQ